MSLMNEPVIIVNGQTLTPGQAMTVRVALSSLLMDIEVNGLGDDVHGRAMAEGYKARIGEIFAIILKGAQ